MQLKTILSAFVRPVKEKLPFFCLFLVAIDAIPLRLLVANIHYRNFGAIGDFFLEDFPRAGVIAYLATLVVYFFRKKWVLMGGVCIGNHLVGCMSVPTFGVWKDITTRYSNLDIGDKFSGIF